MMKSSYRPIVPLVATMLGVLVVIIAAGWGGIAVIDSIRGYATGGTHYAKSHLGAVSALREYARYGRPEDFRNYERRIGVAVNDRVAREILEQHDLPWTNSVPFLIGGKNHPDDAVGMAWLFRHFHELYLFKPAVGTWREADREIQRIGRIAGDLRRTVESGAPTELGALLEELTRVSDGLIELEDRFASEIGTAARSVKSMLFWGLIGLGVLLALLVVGLGYFAGLRLKQARAEILLRETRFRDVAEIAADWIWEVDENLRFTLLHNRHRPEDEGRVVDGNVDVPLTALSADNDRKNLQAIADHAPFRAMDIHLSDPDVGQRRLRLNGKPVFDAQGFAGYRGTGSDVTEEVEARQEALAKQAALEATFENMSQGIAMFDGDFRLAAFNRRFLDLLDLPEGCLLPGDTLESFIRYNAERGEYGDKPVDEAVAERIGRAHCNEPIRFERERPNGVVVEIRTQPLPAGGFVATYTDVTERHENARNLIQARLSAEHANDAKTLFLANMSHELRTPLNAIIGFAAILNEQMFGPLSERYQGYATDIRESGEHLLSVINDILDLTKVETGHGDYAPERVDLRGTADSCLRFLMPKAAEARVLLHNEIPAGSPEIQADGRRVKQILLNLVGNAVKFSNIGGSIWIRRAECHGYRGFRVVDEGIGMEDAMVEKALQPFVQLEGGLHRRFDGAGLGLALVQRFVDMHDGLLTIDSEPGRGTTVTVLFPDAAAKGGSVEYLDDHHEKRQRDATDGSAGGKVAARA